MCVSECRWSGVDQCQVLPTLVAVAVTCQALSSAGVRHHCIGHGHGSAIPAVQLTAVFVSSALDTAAISQLTAAFVLSRQSFFILDGVFYDTCRHQLPLVTVFTSNRCRISLNVRDVKHVLTSRIVHSRVLDFVNATLVLRIYLICSKLYRDSFSLILSSVVNVGTVT